MTDEPRYTLDEARALLAAQDCASNGHSLNEVRTGAGDTLWVYCDRCPARFVPAAENTARELPADATTSSWTSNPWVLLSYLVSEDGEPQHPMDVSVLRVDLDEHGQPTSASLDRVRDRITRDATAKVARRPPSPVRVDQ